MPIVYCARNIVNGRRYIGVTKYDLIKRWNEHRLQSVYSNACRVFYTAIRKYGFDAFAWEVLSECDDYGDALNEEIRLVAQHAPAYNMTRGGQGIVGMPRSDEWKKKLSIANSGRKLTESQRERSIQMLAAEREKRHRSVVCLNDGTFFATIRDCAAAYSISVWNVASSVSGRQTHSKGLSFCYSVNPLSLKECETKLIDLHKRAAQANLRRKLGFRVRSVVCVNDSKKYRSATEASRYYGIRCPSSVTNICIGGGETGSGLRFRYADRDEVIRAPHSPERIAAVKKAQDEGRARGVLKNSKRVVCHNDKTTYGSISEAARAHGLLVSAVSAAIYRNGRASGLTFKFEGAAA